ncbi:MAG: InlB B-repeat-containing protein [Bacilli bacterium]|nr:InlB B-repeat-containing protein [Bacilli bacterium]MDD7314236.1 InlB B-repeat-containing protein [Bacilli bacterium]MDY4053054.1 InlB B-repeat-containing protein [Bacilli bacterium]
MANMNDNNSTMTVNDEQKASKRRKIVLWSSLGAFVLIILLLIFFFKQPVTITFVTNRGSTIDPIAADSDGYISVPNDPKREYWDFEGWYRDEKLTSKIEDLSKEKFTTQTKIYAKWRLHRYTITYELDGGKNNPNNPTIYVVKHDKAEDETWEQDFNNSASKIPLPDEDIMNRKVELYAPTKEGYTFDGWYTTPDFAGNSISRINNSTPADIILYAKWK